MTNLYDPIRVGNVWLMYSVLRRGWVIPGDKVIKNPLKAQRIAEALHNKTKKVAA